MNPAPQISADEQARWRIENSLDESLLVEASAGTGKTTELVRRIVAVLKNGAKIDRIAAVTFTHKAAGQLKLKLREELDRARGDSPALEDALERLEEASVGTIHSFCAQILRERPVEARIDPAFEELTEPENARLYQRAFRRWLEMRLANDSPGLRRAFARLAWPEEWMKSRTSPIDQLLFAGRNLIEWRDYPAAWQRDAFDREGEIQTLLRMVRELAERSSQPRNVNDRLFKTIAPARALTDAIAIADRSGVRDFDELEARLIKLGRDLRRKTNKGSGLYSKEVPREQLVSQRDELIRWIFEFQERADADLAALLRSEMQTLLEEYDLKKRQAGKLDFVDLLIAARDLVRDNESVRRYLQARFTHLFIDEFQDTEPLQAEILLLLSSADSVETDWRKIHPAPGKLFVVGDPKQSIYKFRRADMVLYREIRDALCDRGVGFVRLTKSFRAVRPLQQLVNAAFEPEMTGDAQSGQAEYAPLEEHRPAPENRPSIVILPVPRPYGQQRISKDSISQCLPDAIAAYTDWLLKESGWGFRARDVAILFRQRVHNNKDLTREVARGLEARDVPHLLAGSKTLHHREEVETLRAALTAIEWPDDELNVFATLKGSLFAIPDELLLRYRTKFQRLNPFHPAEDSPEFEPITSALSLIRDLHRSRNQQSFASTANALLEATRAYAGFVLRPGGQQILANVARVAELARSYESSGGISFRGFVEELAAQAEREEAAEAPLLEEDADGVRLMTVHGAKGLEFPVVILADLTTNLSKPDPERHVDGSRKLCATRLLRCAPRELADHVHQERERERAEGVRVAYVAATRASDLLVIPAIGDEAFEGWLAPLNKAIYPSRATWRRSEFDSSCPPFGDSSVLSRPIEYDRQGEISVRPGLHRPESGEHSVIWWDPSRLRLGVDGGHGLQQQEILADDAGVSLNKYREWLRERDDLRGRAAQPHFDILLASQTGLAPPRSTSAIEMLRIDRNPGRPSGRRFGALFHATIRDAALDATLDDIRALSQVHARLLSAPAEERDAASLAVESALAHPLLERARKAARCHREYPLTLKLDANQILEGVIDLAFVEDGIWTVVDFKTDADAEAVSERYLRQIQWYTHALERLTGMPARGILLSV